jgi:hypothetical protein
MTQLPVEIGFTVGSSDSATLSARRSVASAFRHVIFDRWPMSEFMVADLSKEYPNEFVLASVPSAVGLSELTKRHGYRSTALVPVDGSHHFEIVMTNITLADHLCRERGFIVLDDANASAIEPAINYNTANRPDCAVAQLGGRTTARRKMKVMCGIGIRLRPFLVPDRPDWNVR